MKKNTNKKIFIFTFFLLINLIFINKTFAAKLSITPSKDSVGTEEQFYVDLILDPEGQSFNAIKGDISFSEDNATFLRAEDGKSMVNLWVEKPKVIGGTISFAGLMSNGFEGVIDPFDTTHKLPGLIIRLVFETKKPDQVNFYTSPFTLNKNDGQGTEFQVDPISSSIKVENFINRYKYENNSGGTPELEAFISRDKNIFDNKYTLFFKASDKETGIKSVMIKEGRSNWEEVESPYLLRDQSRHSQITVQALNFSGASIIVNIDKIPYNWNLLTKLILLVIISIVGLIILIIKKNHANKK
jgi:hypothetical protein